MKAFGKICYVVCQFSIVLCLVLSVVMIWGEVTDDYMWKALTTSMVFFLASGIAFAVNREFLKEPMRKDRQEEK